MEILLCRQCTLCNNGWYQTVWYWWVKLSASVRCAMNHWHYLTPIILQLRKHQLTFKLNHLLVWRRYQFRVAIQRVMDTENFILPTGGRDNIEYSECRYTVRRMYRHIFERHVYGTASLIFNESDWRSRSLFMGIMWFCKVKIILVNAIENCRFIIGQLRH